MKAAICYEVVMLVACTLNIILKIPKKIVERFYIKWNRCGGACQYSFEFNFSPLRVRKWGSKRLKKPLLLNCPPHHLHEVPLLYTKVVVDNQVLAGITCKSQRERS